jgi:hypothetical protein
MSKKNAQKVKERERKVKAKLLRRREAMRKKARAEREDAIAQREAQKIDNRVNGRTIINRSPEDQHALLQRNLDILKALEDQQQFLEQQKRSAPPVERSRKMKQSADVSFIPNPETNEPLKVPVEKNAEVDFTPKLSDTKSPTEEVQQAISDVLEDDTLDPAATRLAEKLESLSKKRTMGLPK